MSKNWYKNSYRRNLVDMHIEDWNGVFLSEFDVDEYFENLKRAKVDSVMLYLQSHVGLCYYPTKTGIIHKAWIGREDLMKRLVDKCRASGIAVVGYYSLIFNTREEDRHPEWRIVIDRKNKTSRRQNGGRYGLCCPNNSEYREFVKAQIKELFDYFTLDGIFYDMTYWQGVCYCESCQKRFEAETGKKYMPDLDDLKSEGAMDFVKLRYGWISEFAKWVTDYTRSIAPDVSVTHNCAYCVTGDFHQASGEWVSENCDYCGGDLYGDVYKHSFCMKYYLASSKNQPFEYMTGRFSRNLKQHTMTKTKEQMTLDMLLTVAHHGANTVIDAIDPIGTLDSRVYDFIGEVYSKQIPYEKYMIGMHIADVAVWYSSSGRFNLESQGFDSRTCGVELSKNLSVHNIPYAVMPNTKTAQMGKYKFVFAPSIAGLDEKHINDAEKYVSDGGVLWFSGAEQKELLKVFFGADVVGYSEDSYTYVAPTEEYSETFGGFNSKYPLAIPEKQPLLKNVSSDTVCMAYVKLPYKNEKDPLAFASIHSNPPGTYTEYPAFMMKKHGKGTVIWSSSAIE